MGLLDQVKIDVQSITTDVDGFSQSATFTAPEGATVTINILHAKHHTGYSEDGERVNTKYASIAVAEKSLSDLSYPLRNAQSEVDFESHRVDVADSTGIVKNYVISEWYPDETVGLIVLILGDFES